MQRHATPVPWVVAETVALKIATLRPARVAIVPADTRLERAVTDASAELQIGAQLCPIDGPLPVDLLVWSSSSHRPTAGARRDLLEHAGRSTGDLLICERAVDGHGLGTGILSRIDPQLRWLATDEVCDDALGIRARKPWEPPVSWVVAEAAAWRFLSDGEMARNGFLRRIPRMSGAQMVLVCRRILSRFDTGHELLVLALQELAGRGDTEGVDAVMRELKLHGNAPRSVRLRASELAASVAPHRPTVQLPVAV